MNVSTFLTPKHQVIDETGEAFEWDEFHLKKGFYSTLTPFHEKENGSLDFIHFCDYSPW